MLGYSHIINLLPGDEQRKRREDILNYYTLVGGMVVVTGALALAGLLLLFDQLYRLNLADLTRQKEQAQSQSALFLDTEKKAADLSKQLQNLQKANAQTSRWANLMTALQTLTPPTVSVRAVDVAAQTGAGGAKAQKTTLQGTAESRRALGEFQLALAGSPLFKNVEIITSNLVGSSGEAVDYQISVDVAYDKLAGRGT